MNQPSINFPRTHPTLSTKRLLLTQPSIEDAPALFNIRSDSEFMRYLGKHPMKNLSEAEAYIEKIHNGFVNETGLSWKICEKGNKQLIGYLGFWSINYEHFSTEIGYGIHPNYQQKGYLTEALHAMVNYVFSDLGIHHLQANVDQDNMASINLLRKCGFEKQAHFKENFYFNGKFLDSIIYCKVNRF